MIIHIWEDPTTIQSKSIEAWLVKLSFYDSSLCIVRHFFTNNEQYDFIIRAIRAVEDTHPALVFPFVHRIKELMLYEQEQFDEAFLEEIAFEFSLCLSEKEPNSVSRMDKTTPQVTIEEETALIDVTFEELYRKIYQSHPMDHSVTKALVMSLINQYRRLTWDELKVVFDQDREQLTHITQELLQDGTIKKSRLGTTQLIKAPAITHCCEKDDCCSQTHSF